MEQSVPRAYFRLAHKVIPHGVLLETADRSNISIRSQKEWFGD